MKLGNQWHTFVFYFSNLNLTHISSAKKDSPEEITGKFKKEEYRLVQQVRDTGKFS